MGRSAEYKPRQHGEDDERPRSLKRRPDSDSHSRRENDELPDLRKVHDVMSLKPVEFEGLKTDEITTAIETLLPEQARVKAPHLRAQVDSKLEALRNRLQAIQTETEIGAAPTRERSATNSLSAAQGATPDASNRAGVDNHNMADVVPNETVDDSELPSRQTVTIGDGGEPINPPSPAEPISPESASRLIDAPPTTIETSAPSPSDSARQTKEAGSVITVKESIDAASPIEKTRRQIQNLKNELQDIHDAVKSSDVMRKYGSFRGSNKSDVAQWTEDKVKANEAEIRLLERDIRRYENEPEMRQLRKEITDLEASVSRQEMMKSHGQHGGSERGRTREYVEKEILAREDKIRQLENRITGARPASVEPTAPESVPSTAAPAPETAASPERGEPSEPSNLEPARAAAARALIKIGRVTRWMRKEELNRVITDYQDGVAAIQNPKIELIKQEFAGRDLSHPDVARELTKRMSEFSLTERFSEISALTEAMKTAGERTAGNRINNLWKNNSGKRIAVGLGLLGAGLATGGLASPVLGAALLAARVAMSSSGSTMMAEGGLQAAADKFGRTRKLSAEQIAGLDQSQIREFLAAHVTRYGERGQKEFGTHTIKILKKSWTDDTGKRLLEQYQKNEFQKIERYLTDHAGETPETVISGLQGAALEEQNRLLNTFVDERSRNRKASFFKWVTAVSVGVVSGAIIAHSGLEHLQKVRGAKAARAALESAHRLMPAANADSVAEAMAAGTGQHAVETGSAAVETAQTTERAASFKEIAHRGDSVWKMAADQVKKHLGGNFDKLEPARQDYIVDSIKDCVEKNPAEYGLTNAHQVFENQVVDFSPAFEGPNGINLPEVVTEAKLLNQTGVESIDHFREFFQQWIHGHPGEPVNYKIIDQLLHGASAVAPDAHSQTAELLGASHEQVSAAMTDQMARNVVQQAVLGLAKTNPELYARFHEISPDCYPAVVGITTDTAASSADSLNTVGGIELTRSHIFTLDKCVKTLDALPHTGAVRDTLHTIGDMKVTAAAKASTISSLLEKVGLNSESARETGQALRKVARDIAERIGPDTKVKNIFESIHKNLA